MNSRVYEQIKRAYGQQLVTVRIAVNTSTSTDIDLTNRVAYGLTVEVLVPWTDAALGVQVSEDGSTWVGVYDEDGARIQIDGISTTVRRVYRFDSDLWAIKNYPFVRLESVNASTGAAVNQGGLRTLRVGVLS
jgi:hypothetical protein